MNTVIEFVADLDKQVEVPNTGGLIAKQVSVDVLCTTEDMSCDVSSLISGVEVHMDKDRKLQVVPNVEKLSGVHIYVLPYSLICAHYEQDVSNQYWHKIVVGSQLDRYLQEWELPCRELDFVTEEITDAARIL